MSTDLSRPSDTETPDELEFRMLYQDASRPLLAFLLRRCASTEHAADCLAETFRIAWEQRQRIPSGDSARPWLFGVARNVMRRERLSEQRTYQASLALAIAVQQSSATAGDDEDGELTLALAELSPLDREIITMLAWDELSPRAIAQILELSPNVVRVRAHRARRRLRELLTRAHVTDGPASVLQSTNEAG